MRRFYYITLGSTRSASPRAHQFHYTPGMPNPFSPDAPKQLYLRPDKSVRHPDGYSRHAMPSTEGKASLDPVIRAKLDPGTNLGTSFAVIDLPTRYQKSHPEAVLPGRLLEQAELEN